MPILSRQHSLVALIVISLLGCCMEIDVSLPSFPSIMKHFEATEAQVQNTLSLNFLAFCIAGLFYGPLSEAWGRRGLMLFGATCFMVGAIGCVFSFSIYQLMFWRFIQGLGASSTVVLGFAMISDRYSGDSAANYIAKINAYITIFMATAPIIGSVIIQYSNWRANFSFVAVIAFISWACLILQLPETKLVREPLKLTTVIKDYVKIINHRKFLLYAAMPNMLVTAYLTFVGSAAFYYINSCKLSYFEFAIHQGLIVILFSLTSFYSGKIIARLGGRKAVNLGMSCCVTAVSLFSLFAWLYPYQPALITFSMCILAVGCAFPMSVIFARSLEILPEIKGVCSSFIMSTRLLLTSGAIAITGTLFDGSMRPVALIITLAIVLALIIHIKLGGVDDGDEESLSALPI